MDYLAAGSWLWQRIYPSMITAATRVLATGLPAGTLFIQQPVAHGTAPSLHAPASN
jgi:hypothetical protein